MLRWMAAFVVALTAFAAVGHADPEALYRSAMEHLGGFCQPSREQLAHAIERLRTAGESNADEAISQLYVGLARLDTPLRLLKLVTYGHM